MLSPAIPHANPIRTSTFFVAIRFDATREPVCAAYCDKFYGLPVTGHDITMVDCSTFRETLVFLGHFNGGDLQGLELIAETDRRATFALSYHRVILCSRK